MSTNNIKITVTRVLSLILILVVAACAAERSRRWLVHDMNRPKPRVVTPGGQSGAAPSDAIVLFDGTDLSAWKSVKGSNEVNWKVENGHMQVVPKTGDILTKQAFGSCQLHIEWRTPEVIKGAGQKRNNSGIFLMGKYEMQVPDSYNNVLLRAI